MEKGSSPLNYPAGAAASAVYLFKGVTEASLAASTFFERAQETVAIPDQKAAIRIEASRRFLGAYTKEYYATIARESQLARYCWERACEVVVDASTEQDGGAS
jgi:hypothetical protein